MKAPPDQLKWVIDDVIPHTAALQSSSMIALGKALFGDFPFEEIIDNSRGYMNGVLELFLTYLFLIWKVYERGPLPNREGI